MQRSKLYSITSSAIARRLGGKVRPNALTVLRLMAGTTLAALSGSPGHDDAGSSSSGNPLALSPPSCQSCNKSVRQVLGPNLNSPEACALGRSLASPHCRGHS